MMASVIVLLSFCCWNGMSRDICTRQLLCTSGRAKQNVSSRQCGPRLVCRFSGSCFVWWTSFARICCVLVNFSWLIKIICSYMYCNGITLVCVFVFRVVLLVLSSGYIGLRIVALEEQLTTLGALPEFALHNGYDTLRPCFLMYKTHPALYS